MWPFKSKKQADPVIEEAHTDRIESEILLDRIKKQSEKVKEVCTALDEITDREDFEKAVEVTFAMKIAGNAHAKEIGTTTIPAKLVSQKNSPSGHLVLWRYPHLSI